MHRSITFFMFYVSNGEGSIGEPQKPCNSTYTYYFLRNCMCSTKDLVYSAKLCKSDVCGTSNIWTIKNDMLRHMVVNQWQIQDEYCVNITERLISYTTHKNIRNQYLICSDYCAVFLSLNLIVSYFTSFPIMKIF